MKELDKQVNQFLNEVGVNSSEHRRYMERMNSVLDEMKNSLNASERKYYNSFKETVTSFENFINEKNIHLTGSESDRFGAIASSRVNSLAKKRMMEDLIYKIKERHSNERIAKVDEEKRKSEIDELNKSGSWFKDWFRIFLFAFEYKTITLFTHRYRLESLDVIRSTLTEACRAVSTELERILDNLYSYLSVMEYNSILKLHELEGAVDNLVLIKNKPAYYTFELLEEMGDFTGNYICVLKNARFIDSGLKKVFKEQQPPHGFWGYIGILTERPLQRSRIISPGDFEIMTRTVSGSIFSFYTAHAGVRVRTFNQLLHITFEDGRIDSTEKHLTDGARARLEQLSRERNNEIQVKKRKMDELLSLVDKYHNMGKSLFSRLFEIESRGNLFYWNREAASKPFFKTVRVLDAFIKHLLVFFIDNTDFCLEYDEQQHYNYLDKFPELIRISREFAAMTLDLQSGRGKDAQNFKIARDTDPEQFITFLMNPANDNFLDGNGRIVRETLSEISSRCYNLCITFHKILTEFEQGHASPEPSTGGLDFLNGARLYHPGARNLQTLFARKDVFLVDLLEACCAVSEYISEYLHHNGIGMIHNEIDRLKIEINGYEKDNAAVEQKVAESETEELELGEEQHERIYSDSHIGLKKWEYFEDFILPEFYDERHDYRGEKQRHVFCAMLSNLVDINKKLGNDAGDRVFRKVAGIISESLRGGDRDNVFFRGEGGIIIGYINNVNLMEALDVLFKILHLVNTYSISQTDVTVPELIFNAGIYTERPGTDAFKNIDIARSIMFHGDDGQSGRVAFIRNPDRIVSDKDFEKSGKFREGIVSLLS